MMKDLGSDPSIGVSRVRNCEKISYLSYKKLLHIPNQQHKLWRKEGGDIS
jgi:hypothetical protein